VIRFRFGHEDLVRTRFAISPLFDLVWSTDALRDPARRSLHLPWVRAARERLRGFDYTLLDLLGTSSYVGYVPDFISPPPTTPLAEFDDELARVRATPHEQVAREVRWCFEGKPIPHVVQPLLDDPDRALDELTRVMTGYFERAIAPWWPAIRAALEADIVHRARRLTAGGAIEVFEDLHPQVQWRDGVLEVERPYDEDVDLRGRGLLLVPAAFAWPEIFALYDEPWHRRSSTRRAGSARCGRRRRTPTATRSRRCSGAAAPRSSRRSPLRQQPPTSPSASPRRLPASTSTSASCAGPASCAPPATDGASSMSAPRWARRCCAGAEPQPRGCEGSRPPADSHG